MRTQIVPSTKPFGTGTWILGSISENLASIPSEFKPQDKMQTKNEPFPADSFLLIEGERDEKVFQKRKKIRR